MVKYPKYPLGKILKSYIGYKTQLKNFIRPFSLVLAVTRNCNLRCEMCTSRLNGSKNELNLEEIKRLLASSTLKDLVILSLTGGEPFLRDDIADIAIATSKIIPQLSDFRVATNGTLTEKITSAIHTILARTNLEVSVKLSLDGFESTHDRIRGVPGTFARVLSSLNELKNLRKENDRLHLSVGFTVTDRNIHELPRVFEKFRNEVDFFFKPAQRYSRSLKRNTELLMSSETRLSLLKFIDFFSKDGFPDKKGLARALQGVFYRYMKKFIENPEKRPLPCSAGYSSFHIEPDGSVYICGLSVFKIGNIRETGLDEIWLSPLANKVRRLIKEGKCTCYTSCDLMPSIVTCRWPEILFSYMGLRK